jgi:hypothetical protein
LLPLSMQKPAPHFCPLKKKILFFFQPPPHYDPQIWTTVENL